MGQFFFFQLNTTAMKVIGTILVCLVAGSYSVPYSTSSASSAPVKAASPYYTPPVYSEVGYGYPSYPGHVHYPAHGSDHYGHQHPYYHGLLRKNNNKGN